MKKTVLSMALFAIIVGVVVSACSKDDANTVKNTPMVVMQTSSGWPEGALTRGDDTYYYKYDGQRITVERVDSMLSIKCYAGDILDQLPNNFVVLKSEACARLNSNTNGRKALVLFSDMDRSTAIEELKRVDGIYCIEPVYRDLSTGEIKEALGRVALRVSCPEDTVVIRRFADSIHCEVYTTQDVWQWAQQFPDYDYGSIPVVLWMEHSVVNSVVAGNMLVESGRALGTYSVY